VYGLVSVRKSPKTDFWANIDILGVPANSGILGWTCALIGSISSLFSNIHNGYKTFSKNNRLFAVPNIWTGGIVIVLPPSMLYLLNRPGKELGRIQAQLDTIQMRYIFADQDIYENVFHFDLIRKHMSKANLNILARTTAEELDNAFRVYWGTDTSFKVINNWDLCGKVISRAAMRTFVGETLCHDEELLKLSWQHSDAAMAGTFMINIVPPRIRPWVGPLFGLQAKYFQRRCLKIMVPYIEDRMRILNERNEIEVEEPVSYPNFYANRGIKKLQQDFIQWLIARCVKEGGHQMDATKIALRVLALITMSVMGFVYIFAHCILDLYGSSSKQDTINALESECRVAFEAYQGLDKTQAVDSLHHIDSTLRESMRISDINVSSLSRDVEAEILDLGNGMSIPRGTRVVFPTQPIHLDPQNYENALNFDPFRFSRGFQDLKPSAQRDTMTTISPSFLVFGYGRHSCPGKWFASQTLKQALAYVILNYEIDVVGKVPARQTMLNVMMPRKDIKIMIRQKRTPLHLGRKFK
jgi:hypothetical protein